MKKCIILFSITIVLFGITSPLLLSQWVQTNGPCGGDVRAFAASGSNLFAGTLGAGVFLSTDNGTNWKHVGLSETYVYSLVFIGTTLYAGTDDGIYLSTDNGKSWSQGTIDRTVYTFAIKGGIIFAGTDYGVYRSTDNGTTWTAVNTGLRTDEIHALGVLGSKIFAGTYYHGVYLSTNDGASWVEANNNLTDKNIR